MLRLSIVALLLLLSGCSDDFAKFYRATSVPPPPSTQPIPTQGEPELKYGSGNLRQDVLSMFADGYGVVGISAFTGPSRNANGALKQAKRIGAAVVIISSNYRNTVSGEIPITLPTAHTSYSSGTVNAYGTGGSANATYSGTTTTYGTQTTYMPYSVDRYDQAALFFMPLERKNLGVMVAPLTDQQHQIMGTNMGVAVVAVRKGSPAFFSDMLPGDIIMSIGGKSVFDVQSELQAVSAACGSEAEIDFFRGGKSMSKQILIPAGEW